jgi:hypothetical protein
VAIRWLVRVTAVRDDAGRRMPGDGTEVHMSERERELERQRKQRQARTPFRTPEPAHLRHARFALGDKNAVSTG